MGITAEGLSGQALTTFFFALALGFLLFYLIRKQVASGGDPFPVRVLDNTYLYVFIYLVAAGSLLVSLTVWLLFLDTNHATNFLEPVSARAWLYESRSLLGMGLALSVASLALFIPLLLSLWNNFFSAVDSYLTDTLTLRSARPDRDDRIEGFLARLRAVYSDLDQVGIWFQFFFKAAVVLNLLLIFLTGVAFFWKNWLQAYVISTVLAGFGVLILLFFLVLLSIFAFEIQPRRGELNRQYRELYLALLED